MSMTAYLDNLVGALGLSITDIVAGAVARSGGQLAEALVLTALRPGLSIKRLAERLRLSHPGAVRLVDRLVEARWAERQEGADRRAVRLVLTAAGQAEVERLRQARSERLADVLGVLTSAERAALEPIAEKLIRALTTDLVAAYANCRLCDTPACEARGCPVEDEARARFTPAPNEGTRR
jgi:MarR family transcriptional repressor of emrRAB